MAKDIHVAQATNFRGIVLAKRHLPFTNNLAKEVIGMSEVLGGFHSIGFILVLFILWVIISRTWII
jgi:hypothetical protein